MLLIEILIFHSLVYIVLSFLPILLKDFISAASILFIFVVLIPGICCDTSMLLLPLNYSFYFIVYLIVKCSLDYPIYYFKLIRFFFIMCISSKIYITSSVKIWCLTMASEGKMYSWEIFNLTRIVSKSKQAEFYFIFLHNNFVFYTQSFIAEVNPNWYLFI